MNKEEMNLENIPKTRNERIPGLDVIRTVATFFVVCIHFYLNCGYYSAPMEGTAMFVMTYGRWLFLICVPLFLLLTGYFKSNKKLCKEHYKSLIPILTAYVVISVIKIIASNHIYGTVYTFSDAIRNILNYQMAWYVGLYISLMLLVPFLNIMWHALDLKQKQVLMISLLFISTLYPLIKVIAPSYWQMLYPLVYYFMGAYIKERQPKIKKWLAVLILLGIVTAETIGVYYYSKGVSFKWDFLGSVDNGYNALPVVACTVIVFLCLYDIKIKTRFVAWIFEKISSVSFEIYLFAGIFDAYLYFYAKRYIMDAPSFLPYFLPLVLLSFVGAAIASFLYQWVYRTVEKKIVKCNEKRLMKKHNRELLNK